MVLELRKLFDLFIFRSPSSDDVTILAGENCHGISHIQRFCQTSHWVQYIMENQISMDDTDKYHR